MHQIPNTSNNSVHTDGGAEIKFHATDGIGRKTIAIADTVDTSSFFRPHVDGVEYHFSHHEPLHAHRIFAGPLL